MSNDRADLRHSAFYFNLEQQRKRAKDLLRDVRVGDPDALRRIADAHSSSTNRLPISTVKLTDAQLTIARELRFESWPKLKDHIERMDRHRMAIARKSPAPDVGMKTLHLRCGSDIRDTLKAAGFNGDFLEHNNPYCQGPVTNTPDYYEKRARFVFDAFSSWKPMTFEGLAEDFRRNDEEVARAADDYERVVLWAEHDNYDQFMVIRVLALYAIGRKPRTFELIGLNEFPGAVRFLGLGQLPAEALRMLWASRRPVTAEMLELASRAWDALRFADPHPFATIARMKDAALPDLPSAAHRHLQELPSLTNGLSLTEHLVLQALSEEETCTINRIFQLLHLKGRDPLPYMGDAGLAHVIRCMETASEPAFVRTSDTRDEHELSNRLTITDIGRAVLTGQRDWLSLNPPERWVGGVRIEPRKPAWRWNEGAREIVLA